MSASENDSPTTEFLYDFIYLDRTRIQSLYAQLSEKGSLVVVRNVDQTSHVDQSRFKLGVPSIAGGESHTSKSGSSSRETHYDASWFMPVETINRLDDLGYIYRDLASTPVGQLVLIKGSLQILDIRMLRELWPSIIKIIGQGNIKLPSVNKQDLATMKNFLPGFLNTLPHALQMNFLSEKGESWATMNPDMMNVNSGDLGLKHGTLIPGDWHMLAVLDVRPTPETVEPTPDFLSTPLGDIMVQVMSAIQQLAGRPGASYGVTPVAIFRPLKSKLEITAT